jgi:hypothetical protein
MNGFFPSSREKALAIQREHPSQQNIEVFKNSLRSLSGFSKMPG